MMEQLNIKTKGTKETILVYSLLYDVMKAVKDSDYYSEIKTDFMAWWDTFEQHRKDFMDFDRFRTCKPDERRLVKFGKILSYHLSKLYHVRESDWKIYFHGDDENNGVCFTIPGELLEYDYDEYLSRHGMDYDPYSAEEEWDKTYTQALEKYIKGKLQNDEPVVDHEFDHAWNRQYHDLKKSNYKNNKMYGLFKIEE